MSIVDVPLVGDGPPSLDGSRTPVRGDTAEHKRLDEARAGIKWRRWGTYLAERQWGTVREDYSVDGNAWAYFTHEHARMRAYRWGEDGLLGLCDSRGVLNFSIALWNGQDPYLKERLFGLSGPEGNHGETVGELYWYLDATPTHSYARALYKYPQRAFPYDELRRIGREAGRGLPSPRIQDTGVFDDDRYFDVGIEYAKAGPDDVLIRITVTNRGPDPAALEALPTFWYRNTWAWDGQAKRKDGKPELRAVYSPDNGSSHIEGTDSYHARVRIWVDDSKELLFTDNETNTQAMYGSPNKISYVKDAFHQYIVKGQRAAVSPARAGTKAAGRWTMQLAPGETRVFRARMSTSEAHAAHAGRSPFDDFDAIFAQRKIECDAFYDALMTTQLTDEAKNVQRQALAGLLWSKQYYAFDIERWLAGDAGAPPPPPERRRGRNREWRHLYNSEVLSMPDKWEYPWYAAWDLAFHCIPLALVDPDLAKEQLVLLTREWYMHPNGQLPAYEWAFGDVNPPVHAWAALRVYQIDRRRTGKADRDFLESVFLKLMLNFTWWVNRKDAAGNNVFQGGFLGLDNIGVFDRSNALPQGGLLEQADATSWMGMYCLNLLAIALELATTSPSYQDVANKFFEHFLLISHAMTEEAEDGVRMWDEEDGFFYDSLHLPGRGNVPMRVRSMVGLIPIFAVETIEEAALTRFPDFVKRAKWFMSNRPEFAGRMDAVEAGTGHRRLLSILDRDRLARVLSRVLDENEFLSPYGVRALSRVHMNEPYEIELDGVRHRVDYEPGESSTGLFGGNSNWRGPVWFPVNYLMIEALQKYHHYYGESFRIECPTGSGRYMNLWEVASELSRRLASLFLRDDHGVRPADGGWGKGQSDPHFRDLVTFYEYFHGEDGLGLGATHQTGWTALVAKLIAQSPKWGAGRGKK